MYLRYITKYTLLYIILCIINYVYYYKAFNTYDMIYVHCDAHLCAFRRIYS